MDVGAARDRFMEAGLDETAASSDPLEQFDRWFVEVRDAGLYQPEAMVLATVTADGGPAARYVLLRGVDERGFRFFSDTTSDKGHDLSANADVALVFTWHDVSRQVRIRGRAEPLDEAAVDEYWAARPRGSQVAAAASRQSRPVADRASLDGQYAEALAAFREGPVRRPESWRGWRVVPAEIEFWQGRAFRFHDRLRYRRDATEPGAWHRQRLQP